MSGHISRTEPVGGGGRRRVQGWKKERKKLENKVKSGPHDFGSCLNYQKEARAKMRRDFCYFVLFVVRAR